MCLLEQGPFTGEYGHNALKAQAVLKIILGAVDDD